MLEQTMNQPAASAEEARTSWRSVGSLAATWADRVAVVRLSREAAVPDADLAARLGFAAE